MPATKFSGSRPNASTSRQFFGVRDDRRHVPVGPYLNGRSATHFGQRSGGAGLLKELGANEISEFLRLHRSSECLLGRNAVDREHHPFKRARLVFPDGADHQPRRLVQREATDAGAERHQCQ
jgi:hypothetical protein